MPQLTLDQIYDVPLRHQTVKVLEWGGEVEVWELDAAAQAEFEDGLDELGTDDRIAKLVQACMGDAKGPFTDPPADIEKLKKRSAVALMRVYNAALALNVLTQAAREEVLGNSRGEPHA